ncbi:MAG: hypothetical protein SGPRY_011790, partial [Prymnesium sp.]
GFGKKRETSPSPAPAVGAKAGAEEGAKGDGLAEAEARGRLALEQLRKESGQAPLRPKRRSAPLTPEEMEPIDPSAGVMPQVVSDRMLRRVVPFAGLPIVGAFAIFCGFYYANTQLDLDLPPQLVAYATQLCVLLSFAGITWGVMSTSWDEEVEGSLLGAEQVGRNFDLMRGVEGQKREEARNEFAEVRREMSNMHTAHITLAHHCNAANVHPVGRRSQGWRDHEEKLDEEARE